MTRKKSQFKGTSNEAPSEHISSDEALRRGLIFVTNPIPKVFEEGVKLRNKKGHGTKSFAKAKTFNVLLPGSRERKTFKFDPKAKTIKQKKNQVAELIASTWVKKFPAAWRIKKKAKEIAVTLKSKRLTKTTTKKLKKQAATLKRTAKEKEKKAKVIIKNQLKIEKEKQKLQAYNRVEKQELKALEKEQARIENEALKKAGPNGVPQLALKKLVSAAVYTEDMLLGRPLKRKIDGKVGIPDYEGIVMKITKMNVLLDDKSKVRVKHDSRHASANLMREYFMKDATKFFTEFRNRSENAYILRVMTEHKIHGQKSKDVSAVGIPRSKFYNLAQLRDKMTQLFDYFVKKYDQYLGRDAIEEIYISGFSMEVVENSVN